MRDNQLVVPDGFPVIEHSSTSMPLPFTGVQRFLRHPYYEFLIQEAREGKIPFVFAVMQGPKLQAFPKSEKGLYWVGVVCSVEGVGSVEPLISLLGRNRVRVGRYIKRANNIWVATLMEQIIDVSEEQFVSDKGDVIVNPEYQTLLGGLLFNIRNKLQQLYQECVKFAGPDDDDTRGLMSLYDGFYNYDLNRRDAIDRLVWEIVFAIPVIDSTQKQHFIELTSLMQRMGGCLGLLELNIDIISSAKRYDVAVRHRIRKKKRRPSDGVPRDDDSPDRDGLSANVNPETAERWKKYEKIKNSISPEAEKAIIEDFNRLNSCVPGQSEWNIFINHLDCLLSLYSTEIIPQERDVSKVEKVLGQSHCGLEDIKERIYDYLATKIRNPKGKAPILCFVGPPGVGKTSIGKSVAESLGLKFVRLSLGGIRDEADIRGHRQTYIGAIPGKIIQEIVRLGVKNPVFMLDEVDKISNDFRGDPSSALLEVLDPEQNYSFQDHYIGAPFDLSGVLFLCTANTSSGIQRALLDRMEVINIAGYTEFEKVQIATEFLVPKQIIETGFPGLNVNWQDNDFGKVISKIVKGYTREAGVRNLERQIHQILSRWGRQVMKDGDDKFAIGETKPAEILITEELVEKLLGSPKYAHERVNKTEVGEAVGLAWTPVGGDILYIQAAIMPFTGNELLLTGSQGETMRESCIVAVSLLRIFLEKAKKSKVLENKTIHIHIPEGAVKKDGPSAGITIFSSLYSEAFGVLVKPFVTMTGEITLKGMVTKVGGIKEKILAAHRDGLKEIILPASNELDVKDKIPEEIKKDLKFHFMSSVDEVLPIVFPEN